MNNLLINAFINSFIDETTKKINDYYALKHFNQTYKFLIYEITRNKFEKKFKFHKNLLQIKFSFITNIKDLI